MNHLSVFLIALALRSSLAALGMTPIAVVVGPRSALQNLSMSDLRRVYLGEARRVGRVQGIQVVEFTPVRREFYERVLVMSEARVKRHWIGLLFAAETTVPPKEFRDVGELREYVADHPNAIAFLPLDQVGPSLRVVSVNGFLPSSSEYPLR
jgi:hypothetical protein